LIYDPGNFFYYDGFKFLTLQKVKAMKKNRNEAKDIKDIALIDTITNGVSISYILRNKIRYQIRVMQSNVKEFRMWKLKYLLPKSLHPIAYKLYNAPFIIKEAFGPQNRTIIYKNFTLNYSRGTSLIHRIIRGKTYEPTFTTQILKSLSSHQAPVFIDIGANIGLISLNILASMSSARIFAFEPGPHQFEMFSKTISDNNLTEKITFYNEALSYEEGEAEFSIHNTKHASGDGFFDTGRAGNSDIIKVKCNTLDRWWAAENKIDVNVVKIDSEGAELWILKGANKLIDECRPTIFFEFNRLNNAPYPYDENDILSYFEEKDYTVKTIIGEPVTKTNIKQITESQDDFIAVPK
jgi:FkbM family methyltransferase